MSRRSTPAGWLAHYRDLIGSWARRSRSPQDAEDAVQDAAISLLESDSLTIDEPAAYFRRSVVNRSVSLHRAARVRQAQSLDDLPDHLHPLDHGADAVTDANDVARLVLRALADLPTEVAPENRSA